MTETFQEWLDNLRAKRRGWVQSSLDNEFDRGIWNATVAKYADPTHFIFELLQNAEDAGASKAKFILNEDAIVFEHNGRPFNRDDIKGITGIGNTTKLEEANKIGCFGIGFKSVYVVTQRPEVHCTIEGMPIAFAITDLVVPELIATAHTASGTRIVLRLAPDKAGATVKAVRETLDSDGPRSLLFLQTLTQLDWGDESAPAWCDVKDGAGGVRTLHSTGGLGLIRSERFILLERPVERRSEHEPEPDERQDEPRRYTVKIALRLNDGGDVEPEPETTRLSVFFETAEPTGLLFRLHGPFQLTDNRANIKKHDAWNARLIEELAALLAESLPDLRDRGLVKRSFLEVMPNKDDSVPGHWQPIRARVAEAFRTQALLPTHAGGHVAAQAAVRGPSDIRDLLGDDGIEAFGGLPGKRWIVGGMRNSRIDTFHATLEVTEWGYQDFLRRCQEAFRPSYMAPAPAIAAAQAWFDGLTDEQVQRFYLLAETAVRPLKRWGTLSGLEFVRIEDGTRRTANAARLMAPDAPVDHESSTHLVLVRSALTRTGRARGQEVEEFLHKIGVKDVSERDYLAATLKANYALGAQSPSTEQHVQHMRRILGWYDRTKDATLFVHTAFLRAEDDDDYHKADDIYLGPPFSSNGLERIYGGKVKGRNRRPLWSGYSRLKRADLLVFMKAIGVEDTLTINTSTISSGHPKFRSLYSFVGTRSTGTGTDIDYFIPHLAHIIAVRDPEVSRMIWNAVSARGRDCMYASYSPNQQHVPRQDLSTLAVILKDSSWIPAEDGTLRKPSAITAADLAAGFSVEGNVAWLNVLDFEAGHRERSEQIQATRRAAEAVGLPPELVVQLGRLSPDARKLLGEEVLRLIASGAFTTPEFPERTSINPERRSQRIAERAAVAPLKTYEERTRLVRTSDRDARQMARPYLRDLYTNDAGEMICQACHGSMPFRLADGTPYFEAPEIVQSAATELAENHLALCPTCCAKWQHANETTDQDILKAIRTATSPGFAATLAGELINIRFVQVHFDDLRTILTVVSQTSPEMTAPSGSEIVSTDAA